MLLYLAFTLTASAQETISFEAVQERAEAMAGAEYIEPVHELPAELADIDYDGYRKLRFNPEHAFWADKDLPFQVQLFHRGPAFKEPVKIHLVDPEGQVMPIRYDTALFDWSDVPVPQGVAEDAGFAGFRLHFPMNRADYFDEVVSFLGASYFRAVGPQTLYGTSARGVAIDTGLAGVVEEFPRFTEFWLFEPTHPQQMQVLALLDGPSISGAYRFSIQPGQSTATGPEPTTIRVEATLYLRKPVQRLGLAPLTSMFMKGEGTLHSFNDFRPEIHDADGLLLHALLPPHAPHPPHADAESAKRLVTSEKPFRQTWHWRPLANPEHVRMTPYEVDRLTGFGLLQRDRDYEHYLDLEAIYQKRPGVWVKVLPDDQPLNAERGATDYQALNERELQAAEGETEAEDNPATLSTGWTGGRVSLLELPTNHEMADNIGAMYEPAEQPAPGEPMHLKYAIRFGAEPEPTPQPRVARAVATFDATDTNTGTKRFIIDFDGGPLREIDPASDDPGLAAQADYGLKAVLDTGPAEHAHLRIQPNPFNGTWRVFFDLPHPPPPGRPRSRRIPSVGLRVHRVR